ncbi:hypothetical protein PSHT_05497, partial [Puccinia striiformis]
MGDSKTESLPGEQDFDIGSVDMREVIDIFHPSAPDEGEEDGDGEQGEDKGDGDNSGVDDGDDVGGQGWFPFGGVLVSFVGGRGLAHFSPPSNLCRFCYKTGFMHNILSWMQYDKVRALMGLLGLNLLHWTSIWRAKAKLRAMLNMEPLRRKSVFKNQCYSLSIKRIIALLKAKCIKPETNGVPNDPNFKMIIPKYLRYDSPKLTSIDCKLTPTTFPNPWRAKADGRIMRHVPITLYCDDTFGNQLKKWNKHISYYYTLSGLPPKVSNQEYLNQKVVDYRDWNETIDRSHELWDKTVKGVKDDYKKYSKAFGVQDVITKGFVDILKDRKKKHEAKKILAIAEHKYYKLFNPFLRLL